MILNDWGQTIKPNMASACVGRLLQSDGLLNRDERGYCSQWENRSNDNDRYRFATKGKEEGQRKLALFFVV